MTDNSQSDKILMGKIDALQEENRRLQQELQENRDSCALYQEVLENAADAIFLGDGEGNISIANQSAIELSGYNYQELTAMNISRLFSAAELQRAPLKYDLLKQGHSIKTERQLTRKDGSTIFVEMNSRVMPDGSYNTFIRDISARKEVEKALRTSEEKFSRVFKLSPDAITLNRLEDGVYLDINQGFTDILGWTAEEVIGHSSLPGDLEIWCYKEDRDRLLARLRQTGEVTGFESTFRCKDGSTAIGLMSARIIEINGELCNLAVSRDISAWVRSQQEQKKLEEQMLQLQKLESLGVLAGGIAHDFNNILMAVIGHCDLAQRHLPVESPTMENLRQIKSAASKAADLSNQMLAYSGKGKFVIEPLNLSHLVKEMEHILAVSISKKAIIRYELAPHLPSVEADATQLRQIIMNLVINASDAIGDQSGVIAVTTGVMDCDRNYLRETWLDEQLTEGRYVFIEVADTGSGIEPEVIDRIFEPFFSTKFTGRGLGMAAVLGIVRGHKGAIKVYSEVNKGSTFKVLLPASSTPAASFKTETLLPHFQDSGLVLLVDDEETVLSIGKAMLEDFGYEVITANNGRAALEIFKTSHRNIHFVLMDLTMPHMDGEEAFREFRRIDPAVKVIICSGYNQQEVSQKFVGKRLAGFLKKPYMLAELQQAIQQIQPKQD